MRVKKSYRKKIINEVNKENLDGTTSVEPQYPQLTMEFKKISGNTNNSFNEKKTKSQGIQLMESSVPQKQNQDTTSIEQLSTENPLIEEVFDNILASIGIRNQSEYADLFFDDIQRQKRSLEEDDTDLIQKKKHLCSPNRMVHEKFMAVQSKYLDLENRVKVLEEKFETQPQGPNGIRHFTESTYIPNNIEENSNSPKKDLLEELSKVLGIDKKYLLKIKKKTPTATARSLIRLKYPNPDPNVGFSQADKAVVEKIINYINVSFPDASPSNKNLRRAMTNYFSASSYKNKSKSPTDNGEVVGELKKKITNDAATS